MPEGLTERTVGPVDVAAFVFDGNRFTGDVAPALIDLQRSGTVRILDEAWVSKDADGSVAVLEISDSAVADAFSELTATEFDLLSEQDLNAVADGLAPDSSALIIVWENTWAARIGAAIRESGGTVLFQERVPREDVVMAVKALDQQQPAAAPPQAAAPQAAGDDTVAKLQELAALKSGGVLTDAEFTAAKAKLLGV